MEAGDRMSYKVAQVLAVMEELAPKHLAESWDNVGLQIGDSNTSISKILVTLTITEELVQQAIADGADLIVAHHPLIFRPLKHLRSDIPLGQLLHTLIKNGMAVYVSHTNLDHATMGLNHWLAEEFALRDSKVLSPLDDDGITGLGRVGYIEPVDLRTLIAKICALLGPNLRYVGEESKMCKKVAICGGSGGDLIHRAAFVGADVLITGDIKYHEALEATQLGLAVIDPGHFATERIMMPKIARYLQEQLPELPVIQGCNGDNPFLYI